MKTQTIKIKVSEDSKIKLTTEVMTMIKNIFEGQNDDSHIYISKDVDLVELKNTILHKYKDNIEVRDNVTHGCYGASSGERSEGLTMYCESSLYPDRFIDSNFDEVVNLEQLCENFATLTELDADQLRESMDLLEIEGKRDNTYNYLGHDKYSVQTLCHADFEFFEKEDGPILLIIKFHCGGDVRGNYTSEVVYKVEDVDDLYSILHPSLQLIDECKIDEIDETRQDLWKLEGTEKQRVLNKLQNLNQEGC